MTFFPPRQGPPVLVGGPGKSCHQGPPARTSAQPVLRNLWLGQGASTLGFEARHIDLLHQHGLHLRAGLRHVGIPRVAAAGHLALDVAVHVQRALEVARVNAIPAQSACKESDRRDLP